MRPASTPVNGGFTARQVMEFTGIPYSTLNLWARRGLIEPSVAKGKGSGNERIYATDDLRVLSVIFTLRRAGVPVRTLRAVVEFMRKNSVSRWLVVSDGQVCTASRDTLSKALANPRSPVSLVLDLSGTGGPA